MVDIEKLTKVLKLEAQDGYQNRKVMRGLEAFITNWVNLSLKANPSPTEARLIEMVADRLTDYGMLLSPARAQAIQAVLEAPAFVLKGVGGRGSEKSAELKVTSNELKANSSQPSAVSRQPSATSSKSTPNIPPQSSVLSPQPSPVDLSAPIISVKGVGEAYARLLEFIEVRTIGDALYYFPFRHEDFSSFHKITELIWGRVESVLAQVVDKTSTRTRNGKEIIEVILSDETGQMRAIFFNSKMVYSLKPGAQVVMSGRVERYQNNSICFKTPQFELADHELLHTGRLVPIYHLAGPLKQQALRRLIKSVVDRYAGSLPEHLPADIMQRNSLDGLAYSVKNLHFPPDISAKERARRRLAFDEFFLIQLGVLSKRHEWQDERPSIPFRPDPGLMDGWYKTLPFELTEDQRGSVYSILADISHEKPMRRLVQGDVGSGKTVVAATALLAVIAQGFQGVMMAPTQILAEQHFKGLSRIFAKFAESESAQVRQLTPRLALLSGSVKKKDKEATYAKILAGEVDIVIGTTAIIQEGVEFNKLGLVITDEQHRFGVVQRSTLRDKANITNPHVLTMTATPIPRSLSLTIYGDLDISLIKTMPPGRKPIKTKLVHPDERDKAYDFIRKQIAKGFQAFVICPLVEESEKIEAKAAIDEHARLQADVFPDLKLALLHGRMKPSEKDQIMLAFRDKQHHLLVATSVIEVGIDIPNASIILIEGADRFGLAQLHQFRGRVGRGEAQSYCLLLPGDDLSEAGQQRLQIIEQSNDGFYLAEQDLKMRGPGEFFGTRQSGVPDLRVAGLGDTDLLELARTEASQLFARDPDLLGYPFIAKKVSQLWSTEGDLS